MIFCLKLKISKLAGPNGLYFSEKLFKCLRVVLDCFPFLLRIPLEARGEAGLAIETINSTNITKPLKVSWGYVLFFQINKEGWVRRGGKRKGG